jgi:membrane protein DedA with SNARE-associated domain
MSNWIIQLVQGAGYFGILVLMTVENVFPPVPSELIMPLAGYLAARDHMTLWGAIVAGTAGSVLGALPLYYLGLRIGSERIKAFADRHGRWVAVSRHDLDRAEAWFDRHGWSAVFFCRLIPGIRSLISIPAGVRRMSMLPFLLVTTAGTALWSTLLGCVGYFLGSNYQSAERYVGWLSWAVIAALLLWYVVRVVRYTAPDTDAPTRASGR